MAEWRDLMEQGEFEEAEKLMLAATEKDTTGYEIVTRAWFYESWGDAAKDVSKKMECYEEALLGFEMFASWSTSGGEGTARMIDVRRLRKKIAKLEKQKIQS